MVSNAGHAVASRTNSHMTEARDRIGGITVMKLYDLETLALVCSLEGKKKAKNE